MSVPAEFNLAHDLDAHSAKAEQTLLLEAIGACQAQELHIEINGESASQVSLQILFAGIEEMRKRSLSYALGPIASQFATRSNVKRNEGEE